MKVIAIGCDHAGYELKERLKSELTEIGHEVIDCGTDSTERVDYPDYGFAVGIKVSEGPADLGVAVSTDGIAASPGDTVTFTISVTNNELMYQILIFLVIL